MPPPGSGASDSGSHSEADVSGSDGHDDDDGDEEDDRAWREGLVVGGSGGQAGGGGARGGGGGSRSDGAGGSQPAQRKRSKASEELAGGVRELARLTNSFFSRQSRDRLRRFHVDGEELRDALQALAAGDHDHLSDDDVVAVQQEDDGRTVVRLGLVEGLLRPVAKGRAKGNLADVRRLDLNCEAGRLQLRVMEPVGHGR